MKQKFCLETSNKYFVEAEDEDDALLELNEKIALNNSTAENEFWDNMTVKKLKKRGG
jgi:hypothetical protein